MLNAVPHHTFNTSQRRSRAKMEEAISELPQDKYNLLCGAAAAKKCRLDPGPSLTSSLTQSFPPDVQPPLLIHPVSH